MAVASAMITRMHASVGCCRPTSLFECRADPSSGSAKFEQSDFKRKSKTAKDFARGMACTGASGLMILRFPPNFARQLSIKARRNCSNIGVAQIVAASVTNIPLAGDTPGVACNTNSVQIDSALLQPALAKGSGTLAVHSEYGSMEKAQELFDKMHHPNGVVWNAMVAAYEQNGILDETLIRFIYCRSWFKRIQVQVISGLDSWVIGVSSLFTN